MNTMVIRDPEPYAGPLALVRCQASLREINDNPVGALLCGVVVLSPWMAYAQDPDAGVLKFPQDIEFKGPLSGPPQTVVVFGDPTKPGVFVSRVKFSAGWKDPPHWHPDSVRTAVVLSGTLYFGSGKVGRRQDEGLPGRDLLFRTLEDPPLYLGEGR